MADIFLSYASEDRERVRHLVDHLQSLGWSVWWDRDLIAGPSFDDKIEEAIAEASCIVVAWSEAAVQSRWVRAEANEGLERDILVPILLEDVRPPLVFRTSQAANLIGWPERRPGTELNTLLAGISALVGASASPIVEKVRTLIEQNSLAVLRFTSSSDTQDQKAIASGMAEEILNKLARIRDLKVIARTSSFLIDPETAVVKEVGEQLGVANVLAGSVRFAGDQVRVSAELIDCATGVQRWTATYTRDQGDIFGLYDEVAGDVGRELAGIISGDVAPRSAVHPEAHLLYLQAKEKLNETNRPRDVMPLVQRAIDLDPQYADGHVLLADVYQSLTDLGYEPPEPSYRKVLASLERALTLDPTNWAAHLHLGLYHLTWNLDVHQALAVGPDDSAQFQATCHFFGGDVEGALRYAAKAEELDPASVRARVYVARTLARLDRMEDASRKFHEVCASVPGNIFAFRMGVWHFAHYASDADQLGRLLEQTSVSGANLRWAKAEMALLEGDVQPLREYLDQQVDNRKHRFIPPFDLQSMALGLGDFEAHLHWMRVTVEERDALYRLPLFVRERQNYWQRLTDWALSSTGESRARMQQINDHGARLESVSARMTL